MRIFLCIFIGLLLLSFCACAPASVTVAQATPARTLTKDLVLYSGDVILVDFDSDTGVAVFAYYELLYGDKLKDYLVDSGGSSEADAQKYVDGLSPDAHIWRTKECFEVDIDEVQLNLMYKIDDGELVEGMDSGAATAQEFREIYALYPERLTYDYETHFSITVEDGKVTYIKQAN